jgi:hypothetical protein
MELSISYLKIRAKFPSLVNGDCETRNSNITICGGGIRTQGIFNSRMFAAVNGNTGKVNYLLLQLIPHFHYKFMEMITYRLKYL